MIFSQAPYRDGISRNEPISKKEISYYRQRFLHAVFEKIVRKFAERAEADNLTKAKVARLLGKDPAQINRSLSMPSNMTLEIISDLALALGCEPDVTLGNFDDPPRYNYVHPSMQPYVKVRAPSHASHGRQAVQQSRSGGELGGASHGQSRARNAVCAELEVAN